LGLVEAAELARAISRDHMFSCARMSRVLVLQPVAR
jgi:hypothetical protein